MKTRKLSAKQWAKVIEAARKGNEKAFEEICRQKLSYILFVCNSVLHNWQDAEDAAQEVLIAMQTSIKTIKAPEAFPAWLNRLSYRTSMRMRQIQMKNQYIASLDEANMEFEDFSIDALPAELLETKESRDYVMNAVKSLPINYRMALIFYYYDNLSVKEIADVMTVTEAAVKNYLFRGRIENEIMGRGTGSLEQYPAAKLKAVIQAEPSHPSKDIPLGNILFGRVLEPDFAYSGYNPERYWIGELKLKDGSTFNVFGPERSCVVKVLSYGKVVKTEDVIKLLEKELV